MLSRKQHFKGLLGGRVAYLQKADTGLYNMFRAMGYSFGTGADGLWFPRRGVVTAVYTSHQLAEDGSIELMPTLEIELIKDRFGDGEFVRADVHDPCLYDNIKALYAGHPELNRTLLNRYAGLSEVRNLAAKVFIQMQETVGNSAELSFAESQLNTAEQAHAAGRLRYIWHWIQKEDPGVFPLLEALYAGIRFLRRGLGEK